MSLTTKIIYSTVWKKERTKALVISAVLQGFRAIDTAGQPIHHREDLVGDALLELQQKHNINRQDLFLQTKFTPISGQDTTKPIPYNSSDSIAQQIITSCHKSLTNLQTSYIDSYLLHSPLPTPEETLEAWETLMKLQDEGKVRMIGLSNAFDVRVLLPLEDKRKIQVVQNKWYEGKSWYKDVFDYCQRAKIMYQCFAMLSGSLVRHPAIAKIAKASGLTPVQTVFRFAQLKGMIPLSDSINETHMRQDVDVVNRSLKKEEFWGVVKQILG